MLNAVKCSNIYFNVNLCNVFPKKSYFDPVRMLIWIFYEAEDKMRLEVQEIYWTEGWENTCVKN